MALVECENGHLYESDLYESCPYCNGNANEINFMGRGATGGRTTAPRGGFGAEGSQDYSIKTTIGREEGEKMSELKIPAFLRYPDDPISEIMFEKNMQQIQNERCRYRFSLYTEIAETVPEIEKQNPPFEINETHYYCKEGSSAWYSVSSMKDGSVLNNPVRNWVEEVDRVVEMFGVMDQVLRVPKTLKGKTYKKIDMVDMEEWPDYNELHGFDESHVYGHIFYLDDQLYKKFILVAKRQDYSWRIEVNIPSEHIQMIPPDFVPAGQTFGKFYPLYD